MQQVDKKLTTRHSSPSYKYDEIPSASHFRLLHLKSGKPDEIIRASLRPYTIGAFRCPKYHCLSYRWKGAQDKVIYVDNKPLLVTLHLKRFLNALRQKYGSVVVWVDAICINQNNIVEKSTQVALMGEIYQNAKRVDVWLGHGFPGHESLFKWVNSVWWGHDLSDWRLRRPGQLDYKHFEALVALAMNDYWSRAWIIQECILAREIVIHWGSTSIDWDRLAYVCRPYMMLAPKVFDEPEENVFRWWRKLALARVRLSPHKLPSVAREFKNNGVVVESPEQYGELPFVKLLAEFRYVHCTVPLDRIYAFLSLAPLQLDNQGMRGRLLPGPNYKISLKRAAVQLLITHGPGNVEEAWGWIFYSLEKHLLAELEEDYETTESTPRPSTDDASFKTAQTVPEEEGEERKECEVRDARDKPIAIASNLEPRIISSEESSSHDEELVIEERKLVCSAVAEELSLELSTRSDVGPRFERELREAVLDEQLLLTSRRDFDPDKFLYGFERIHNEPNKKMRTEIEREEFPGFVSYEIDPSHEKSVTNGILAAMTDHDERRGRPGPYKITWSSTKSQDKAEKPKDAALAALKAHKSLYSKSTSSRTSEKAY